MLATYAFATNQMTAKRHVQLAERGGRRGEGRAGEGEEEELSRLTVMAM